MKELYLAGRQQSAAGLPSGDVRRRGPLEPAGRARRPHLAACPVRCPADGDPARARRMGLPDGPQARGGGAAARAFPGRGKAVHVVVFAALRAPSQDDAPCFTRSTSCVPWSICWTRAASRPCVWWAATTVCARPCWRSARPRGGSSRTITIPSAVTDATAAGCAASMSFAPPCCARPGASSTGGSGCACPSGPGRGPAHPAARACDHGHHRHLFPQCGHGSRGSGPLPLPLLGAPARRPVRGGGQDARALAVHPLPVAADGSGRLHQDADRLRAARQDGVSFHYLEEFLTTADLRAAWKRYLRLAWTSRRLEASMRELCRFEGSRLNFWAYMAEDWAETFRGWRCLERCLQQRGIDNYVKAAGPQRWFTFPLENCPWERMLTHAAHTTPGAGGPVYGRSIPPSGPRISAISTIRSPSRTAPARPSSPTASAPTGRGPAAVAGRRCAAGASGAGGGPALHVSRRCPQVRRAAAGRADAPPPAGGDRLFADETADHVRLLARAVHAGLLDGWEIVVKPHPYLSVEADLRHELGAQAGRLRFADGPHRHPSGARYRGLVVRFHHRGLGSGPQKAARHGHAAPRTASTCAPCRTSPACCVPAAWTMKRALAQAAPPALPDDYLELQPELPRWRALLEL